MNTPVKTLLAGAIGCAMSIPAMAAEFSVEVVNLTRGIYFTPIMVAAHTPDAKLFESGQPASTELAQMAEGGNLAGVTSVLTSIGATQAANPAEGLLAPGASATAELNTDAATGNTVLSVVAMMLPTNDGFIGLNSIAIPTEPGRYVFNVNGYDAGTEANDELVGSGAPGEPGFPVPPLISDVPGENGTGISASAENYVHIHRGVIGDTDPTGGVSDIDSVVHRWLNPVARVIVTVK